MDDVNKMWHQEGDHPDNKICYFNVEFWSDWLLLVEIENNVLIQCLITSYHFNDWKVDVESM